MVSDRYLNPLTLSEKESLVLTMIHEIIHRTRPRADMILNPVEHKDIYDDARKRRDAIIHLIPIVCP